MSWKDMLYFIGANIVAKIVKDNLPDFYYKKVLVKAKRVLSICVVITLITLSGWGVIKLSPKQQLFLLIALFCIMANISIKRLFPKEAAA